MILIVDDDPASAGCSRKYCARLASMFQWRLLESKRSTRSPVDDSTSFFLIWTCPYVTKPCPIRELAARFKAAVHETSGHIAEAEMPIRDL
jgi:hypothetical protein